MENTIKRDDQPFSKKIVLASWVLGVITFILLSPKWVQPFAAWVAPGSFLFFIRFWKGRIKWLWLFLGLLLSQCVAAYEVIPAPIVIFLIMSLVVSSLGLIPYWLQDLASKKSTHFVTTLVFPSLFVTWEFLDSFGGGGVWSSRANSQYAFVYLAQLASVTGLWGITFLVVWFNSIVVWCVERKFAGQTFIKPLIMYSGVLLVVILFGIYRLHVSNQPSAKRIMIGGVTVPQFKNMELIYKEFSGNEITIDPKSSQTSESLQHFSKAFLSMLENPDTLEFPKSLKALHRMADSLFMFSRKAADEGAQIISWSEGSCLIFPHQENELIQHGKEMAREKQIYLLMAYAVLSPGKVFPGKKFMENKAVLIGPTGDVLNEFYKNKPVPMAESSVAGDGIIPVIQTPFGRVSISICYDADFPDLMKQLSKNETDLLLLPSGDWFAISPYHSYMSAFRSIENGSPIFRQVSGGLSFVSDNRGIVQASKNFFTDQRRFWVTTVSIGYASTLYSQLGDWVAYLACLISLATIAFLSGAFLQKKIQRRNRVNVQTL